MLQKLAHCEHAPAGSFLIARPVPEELEESLDDEKRAAFVYLYHKVRSNTSRIQGPITYMVP